MDFPQQIEESLVERPPSAYDVVMESPIYTVATTTTNKFLNNKISPTVVVYNDKMSSSLNSTLEDTTPSDSGVQLLDSESSELMIESLTSQNGLEFDENFVKTQAVPAQVIPVVVETPLVDNNSNVTPIEPNTNNQEQEAMTTSTCSTFDTTENIVYRRKVRKASSATKTPKKRVSFHEDILKNTRTDNIHIEHGFITYKNGRKLAQNITGVGAAGRYSWCNERGVGEHAPTELCAPIGDDDANEDGSGSTNGRNRRLVYRNACSDVLDYGNADIYDTHERNCLKYDNTGVFEYVPQAAKLQAAGGILDLNKSKDGQLLYRCSCSSSNSSLDSDEHDKNSNHNYEQAKSSSCDCIGMSQVNNNLIGDNCYYSEPNMENLNEDTHKKSVWNKEKKPKSSCLKKTKRHTNIIQEQDLNTKVKKFNVHDIKTQLLDNSSKMIFGSLKSIFTMPLPERGVPEGSEDLQAVVECVPELEQTPEHKYNKQQQPASPESPHLKQKPFLSKSLDGSKQVKKFVHNVDEQLRRKNDESPVEPEHAQKIVQPQPPILQRQQEFDGDGERMSDDEQQPTEFRNKFIINCESTVFEHTGVSYEVHTTFTPELNGIGAGGGSSVASVLERDTPIAQPAANQLRNAFIGAPITKTFTNFFRSFKETTSITTSSSSASIDKKKLEQQQQQLAATDSYFALKMGKQATTAAIKPQTQLDKLTATTSSSTISELTSNSNSNTTSTYSSSLPPHQQLQQQKLQTSNSNNTLAIGQDIARNQLEKQTRHLPSPLKKRSSGNNVLMLPTQPLRYGDQQQQQQSRSLHSPDFLNPISNVGGCNGLARGGCGRDSKSTILSEEFDDILTITTTTTTDNDKHNNENELVIVDYPEMSDRQSLTSSLCVDYAQNTNLLKPPTIQQQHNSTPAAKTSLINRFLRNVTQKKILESSIRTNNFFAGKLRSEQKLLAGDLYVPGVRPKNFELIDDLNAEIAMEIEMSGANSPRRRELVGFERELPDLDDGGGAVAELARFELGLGEISIDMFNGKTLQILRDPAEQLLKVFKLYTGYSSEGYMTPVLVFLTDRSLYVADLVRNRLCAKFVLAYADLDVILMGPCGNTVLLSNSARDMQQVLLAGGPYPAAGLVANLELCARRSGANLPAVGQLTLEHLAPLQAFVHANSCVAKDDQWMYYAVVNVPSGTTFGIGMGSGEQEPLGPHVKGFLMHRRLKENATSSASAKIIWNPGYFLLKAGVLYMFNDSSQKLPSWAMALAECQGARRAVKAARPHCFEIMLKRELLQLAAPDEYVASEWLQALLQSASGLFEMQEKHKAFGCSLVVTKNHLITLREDFSAPLRQLNNRQCNNMSARYAAEKSNGQNDVDEFIAQLETGSMLSSALSTPTRGTQRSCYSSVNSTPTKLSQLSRSTTTNNTTITTTTTASTATYAKQQPNSYDENVAAQNYTNMSSVYGKNSGLEILTCADIKALTGIKIPSHNDTWWCILEFSCQEAPLECSDDLVIFFACSAEMQRFLRLLEQLWQAKNNDLFPMDVMDEDEHISEQCTMLYMELNRAWEPLLSAALGYPL